MLIAIALLVPLRSFAGTMDDMDLRSNIEASLHGTARTANLRLKIRVAARVAIPEGVVRDLNQADDVVELAARVRGIRAVDRSGLRFEFDGPGDDAIASRVTRMFFDSPRYASSTMKIAVDRGVVTLTGGIQNASWRAEIRTMCGAIEGVADVADRLETPATPDDRIAAALQRIFGPHAMPRFPGRVRVSVKDGAVALEGHVPSLYHKQLAARDAFAINGVRRIDDRLELDSGDAVKVIDP